MPASMISAPVGSTLKVIGSSIAMVAIGPTPGSTPISVPTRQPMKHRTRFIGLNATEKPVARWPIRSNMIASIAQEPGRERNREPECELEQADAEQRDERTDHDGLAPAHLVARERADHDRERTGDHESERAYRHSERNDGGEHEQRATPRPS